ncbi:MAG TPA: DNA starvation/stationary phase protection protein Dps [Stellaceae bacterium]|nr:DNA starvation/stationary phase protection protein Dps [Stellaceae bacterium]
MFRTRNTLSDNARAKSVSVLNHNLAAAIDLRAQAKQAHWTVRGSDFIAVHELFDRVATEVTDYADLLAERASGLGGVAEGTVQTVAKETFLKPYPLRVGDCPSHIRAVADVLASFGTSVREAIEQTQGWGDADTADIFTEISRGTDQLLWLVESHLEPVPEGGKR